MTALEQLALERTLADLARDSGTIPHVVRAAYTEEVERLMGLFEDGKSVRDVAEAEAVAHVRKKFGELAAHRRQLASRGRR